MAFLRLCRVIVAQHNAELIQSLPPPIVDISAARNTSRTLL